MNDKNAFKSSLKFEPADLHVSPVNLNPEEITEDKLAEIINSLFYTVRDLSRNSNFSHEIQDKFCDYLDACPDGVTGVQMLMSHLKGGWYEIDPETRDYVKQEPMPAEDVYTELGTLITKLNELVDTGLQEKTNVMSSNDKNNKNVEEKGANDNDLIQ